MRARTLQYSWPAIAAALGLAFGAAISAVSVAWADEASRQAPQSAVEEFVCHAQPGGWCDLRDWTPSANHNVNQSAH